MTNGHTVPNLSTAGCPEQVVPTLDRYLKALSLSFFTRPPACSCANEPGCSEFSHARIFESCVCIREHVWESQQVFHTLGSAVGVCLDVSARGCGCVKAYCHWEVVVWEEGTAGSGVTAEACVRCCTTVCHQACTHQPPRLLSPSCTWGSISEIVQAPVALSSLFISRSHRTRTNHLRKPCSVIPHTLILRNPLCRHGAAAQVGIQLVLLSVLLLLLSHLGVAEGRKLWKGLHQAHRLSLTFSNPDECV